MKVAKLEILSCDAGWRNYFFLKLTLENGVVGWSEFDELVRLARRQHGD